MGQTRTFKRFKLVPILIAAGIGYLLGAWNVTGLRTSGLSASETVALRFPEDQDDGQATSAESISTEVASGREVAGDAKAAAIAPPAAAAANAAMMFAPAGTTNPTSDPKFMSNAQLALFSPEPMILASSIPQGSVQTARAEGVEPTTATAVVVPEQPPVTAPHSRAPLPERSALEARPVAAPMHRSTAERPGSMLNDAQIASIKQRLHLTPDQERMWPAVEAALRTIAYKTAHDAHQRGDAQLASAAPDSAEVQNLKSAAIPLIMSFNDEQRDEVRNLAHVMGLDQLASQF